MSKQFNIGHGSIYSYFVAMQKRYIILFSLFLISLFSCSPSKIPQKQTIPKTFLGNFTDDYGITYSISDTLFLQRPNIRYRIIKWNLKEQYIIAQNGSANPSDKNLYTRIDYMEFDNEPFLWGFCYTVYDAESDIAAEAAAAADRQNPKKGCGGYPFSRLKRINIKFVNGKR